MVATLDGPAMSQLLAVRTAVFATSVSHTICAASAWLCTVATSFTGAKPMAIKSSKRKKSPKSRLGRIPLPADQKRQCQKIFLLPDQRKKLLRMAKSNNVSPGVMVEMLLAEWGG